MVWVAVWGEGRTTVCIHNIHTAYRRSSDLISCVGQSTKLVESLARKVYTVIISCDGFHCPSMLTLQPSNRGWMASHGAARLADGKMLNSDRNGVGELLWLTGRAHTVPETKTLRWRTRPKIRLSLSYSFKNLFLLFPMVQLGINELADWTS